MLKDTNLVGDFVRQDKGVGRRQSEVVAKSARAVDPDAKGVVAQVLTPAAAVAKGARVKGDWRRKLEMVETGLTGSGRR